METCSVDGCDKPPYRNGMCNAHNLRLKRHGRLHTVRNQYKTAEERIAAKKRWKRANYENKKKRDPEFQKREYWANRDEILAKSAKYREDPIVQERARQRTKAWGLANPEKKAAAAKKRREEKRAVHRAYGAAYRAKMRQAMPKWLTAAQRQEIVAFYKEAQRLTKETGIQHEVDHIVPLSGRTVCGLHVPWNLRVLTRQQNNQRPRLWSSGSAEVNGIGLPDIS
jgi:hypothetical protein